MGFLNTFQLYLKDFVGLIYPELCLCCNEQHPFKDSLFCLDCNVDMPITDQFIVPNNRFKDIFIGRIKLEYAAAYMYNYKGSKVQQMLHALKYQHKNEIAIEIGKIIGGQISQYWSDKPIDMIIPIPLHPKKQHWRGYNQCIELAKGIHETTQIPINNLAVKKISHTDSQTSKTRAERLVNVSESFVPYPRLDLSNKHVLILDDVVTTGSTLEACALICQEANAKSISMITLAMAMQ